MFRQPSGRKEVYITLDTLENKITNRLSTNTLYTEYNSNTSCNSFNNNINMRYDNTFIRNVIKTEFEKMIRPFQMQFTSAIDELEKKYSFLSKELSLLQIKLNGNDISVYNNNNTIDVNYSSTINHNEHFSLENKLYKYEKELNKLKQKVTPLLSHEKFIESLKKINFETIQQDYIKITSSTKAYNNQFTYLEEKISSLYTFVDASIKEMKHLQKIRSPPSDSQKKLNTLNSSSDKKRNSFGVRSTNEDSSSNTNKYFRNVFKFPIQATSPFKP